MARRWMRNEPEVDVESIVGPVSHRASSSKAVLEPVCFNRLQQCQQTGKGPVLHYHCI
jgi:hypothetical protein